MAISNALAVTLQLDGLDQLNAMQRFLAPATFEACQKAAIRSAGKVAATAVAQQVVKYYNIKSARVKREDVIRGPYFDNGGQSARLYFSRRPPSVLQYGGRDAGVRGYQKGLGRGKGWARPSTKGKGLSVQVIKGGGRKDIKAGFMARAKGGGFVIPPKPLIRRRDGKLAFLYGPSIGSIYLGRSIKGDDIRSAVNQRINDAFTKGYDKELGRINRGYGGKR
jgi:hypothetical protein